MCCDRSTSYILCHARASDLDFILDGLDTDFTDFMPSIYNLSSLLHHLYIFYLCRFIFYINYFIFILTGLFYIYSLLCNLLRGMVNLFPSMVNQL